MNARFIFYSIGLVAIGTLIFFTYPYIIANDSPSVDPVLAENVERREVNDQPPERPTLSALDQMKLEVELKDFDQDGDGKINEAEAATRDQAIDLRITALQRLRVEKYDLDNDGFLDTHEFDQGKITYYKSLLKLYDKNSNGKLSDLEKNAVHKDYLANQKIPDFPLVSPP